MVQICQHCKARSEVPSRFCTVCGARIEAPAEEPPTEQVISPAPAAAPPPPPAPPQDGGEGNRRPIIIGVVAFVCVAAIAGGVALLGSGGKDGADKPKGRTVQAVVQPSPTTETTVPSPAPEPEPEPETIPKPPAPSPTTVAKSSIKRVIHRHWTNIESGRYAAAFAALASGSQRRGQWISAHEQDALTKATVSLGAPRLTSSSTATVPVLKLRTEASSGCNTWRGHYEMVKRGGVWKINKAKITNSPC